MARPDSEHTTALKQFRQRLVEARRQSVGGEDIWTALQRFVQAQSAIDFVDKAMDDEQNLTPLPAIDDPTADTVPVASPKLPG